MGSGACPVFFRETGSSNDGNGKPVPSGPAQPISTWFNELSFDDAVCWAYGLDEDELEDLYWTKARREIQLRIQLKLGEMNARVLAFHSSLVSVVAGATGGEVRGAGPDPDRKNLAAGHSDVNSAVAAINAAMRIG